jgi:hypothetical protein
MKIKLLAALFFIPSVALALTPECQSLLGQYQTLKDKAASYHAAILQAQELYKQPYMCGDPEAAKFPKCLELQSKIINVQILELDLKRGPMHELETQMAQLKCPYTP